ncbi:response regulator transcription factor [Antarcticimicrobium sediminis]|uniref:Response regulator n=1 Tax=Antarcticimicrobium sediminis TaxID=2546227 RepID=A0A4V6PG71_9RHOB|nr:response regulator [Antarcticimicrobium sediminis]TDE37406.1 response regulator [Antarcticimicrobium sediminis]
MDILIVESDPDLGDLWARHLRREGGTVSLVQTQSAAILALQSGRFDIIVLDLMLTEGSALAVADFASYSSPETRVVFVTDTSFFSDGSIFALSANACAYVRSSTTPEDLAAIVEHHGKPR